MQSYLARAHCGNLNQPIRNDIVYKTWCLVKIGALEVKIEESGGLKLSRFFPSIHNQLHFTPYQAILYPKAENLSLPITIIHVACDWLINNKNRSGVLCLREPPPLRVVAGTTTHCFLH